MGLEVGGIVEGKVTGTTSFGAFIELEGGKVGLVHISEISNEFVRDVKDHVQEGQNVKVKILGVGANGKVELSIKQARKIVMPPTKTFVSRKDTPNRKNISPTLGFEDMMSKFKKLSDEKLVDFKEKTKFRRGKSAHKGTV